MNITFFQSSDCSGTQTKSYVATDSQLLPHTFTDHTVPNNSHSNLQLFVSQDGSAVSLLATWINTTIIVRNYANLLGVTLQVPRHLAEESRGLCRGCPPQALFDMLDLNYQMVLGGCTVENEAVLLNCFSGFSTNFRREFLDVNNATYVDACVYSLWRSNSTSIDALSFLGAVSRDAAALPNVQPIVTTSPPPIISFP